MIAKSTASTIRLFLSRRNVKGVAVIVALLATPSARAQESTPGQERAVAAFEKLGAKVKRDLANPGRPVVGLDLRETVVTDRDLANLRELTSLKELSLTSTQIGDAGMIELKSLPSLRKLNLGFTRVSDAGLTHLKGLTALRTLDLCGTKTTSSGVAELERALPKVVVDRGDDRVSAKPQPRYK